MTLKDDMTQAAPFVTAAHSLVFVLADAFRSGWRSGRRVVGTEYVLRELVRRSALWPDRLGPILPQMWDQADRMSPELPDGGSVRMESSRDRMELEIQCEAEGVLREAAWSARRRPRAPVGTALPVWSEGVRAAVRSALRHARSAEVSRAHYPHLSLGILSDPSSRAYRLLVKLGFDPLSMTKMVRAGTSFRRDGDPQSQCTINLLAPGVLAKSQPLLLRGLARLFQIRSRRWFGPIMFAIWQEAQRQEIRRGGERVDQASMLMAICSLGYSLQAVEVDLREDLRTTNNAVSLLSRRGFDYRDAVVCGCRTPSSAGPVDLTRRWRVRPADPPFGADAAAAVERAAHYAARLGCRWIGTTHLLAALLSYPDGGATRMLIGCRGDIGALVADVSQALGVDDLGGPRFRSI